ncbi:uncharacterized protein PV09_08138 [Verruconis gallopava]|uniref:Short-chain dehydrogenase/reductase 3 n=1 Tax=Verruconis gallopava TaxID=253628 RepID=A0A0D1YHD0_9PEZI|nr:uncharacterized protein PV09_08138 [Verruconis gallopava]KIW00247.1 hypothetical protein PV09_08138 [Verruconis gallopava]
MLGLPREGVTVEWLLQPFKAVIFQPVITGLLLAVVFEKPLEAQSVIYQLFGSHITITGLRNGLGVLCGLGLLFRANKWLSRQALNNWTSDRSWKWDREVVVITGGSSGIGEILVHAFGGKGIKVASLDIQSPRKPLPASARFYSADITSVKAIGEAGRRIRDDLGEATVLILNAGIGSGETILAEPVEMLEKTFQVNTLSHFYLAREFLPHMIKHNHGHVVTVASMASFTPIASNVQYSCTKASALSFHEGLAQELKHRYSSPRVRTTVVHPFWTRTPLIERLMTSPHFKKFVLEPETVAGAIVDQIMKGESAQIILPTRFSLLAPLLRGLPSWLQVAVRDADKSLMDIDAVKR